MPNDRYTEILKLASQTENTPELQSYWLKRYLDLYQSHLFGLSDRTEEIVLTPGEANKPSTTFGELNLLTHLDQNNNLDEVKLQSTIESAIRLLDSLLDVIKFNKEAYQIVNQYRKIGLGISNYREYLVARKPSSELDEIDYIGNLVSGYCYRSSESLAEEKGTCGSWDKIKTHLRSKSFEYWYNLDSGEIKNGLEMSEEYDQEAAINSNYEIVPRRNSHILLFPPDLEWQIWSDRDESAPPTEIVPQVPVQLESQSMEQTQIQDAPEQLKEVALAENEPIKEIPQVTIPKPDIQTEIVSFTEPAIISEVDEQPEVGTFHSEIKNDNSLADEPILIQSAQDDDSNQEKSSEKTQIPVLSQDHKSLSEDNAAISNQSLHFDLRPVKPNGSSQELDSSELISKPQLVQKIELNTPNETQIQEDEPQHETKSDSQFQVGELVQIESSTSAFRQQVFQVGEINQTASGFTYKLIGHEHVERQTWSESDLKAVDLFDILDKINLQPHAELGDRRVFVHAFWSTGKDELLIETIDNQPHLPGGVLPWNEAPEQGLIRILNEKYNLKARIADDLGSSLNLGNSAEQTSLHLGFVVEGELQPRDNLSSTKLTQIGEIPTFVQILINKFNRRQIVNMNWEQKLKSLELSHIQALEGLQEQLELQHKALQDSQKQAQSNQAVYQQAPASNQPTNFSITPNQNPNMSKYALKLEQLVQTNAFGDVSVTLQYDSKGPKMIALSSQKLDPELKHLLDTILSILNFMLSRQVGPSEIAILIEQEPQDGVHLPINDLLKVVAASLKEAPASVNNINPSILEDVVPAIKEIAKTSPLTQTEDIHIEEVPVQDEPQAEVQIPAPKPKDENRSFNPFGR